MSERINRRWLLRSRPEALLEEQNLEWSTAPVPALTEGQLLVRNLWLSFDPTQLGWTKMDTYVPKVPLGDPVRAIAVGQVVESLTPEFAVGELVQGTLGWQDYVVTDGRRPVRIQRLPSGASPPVALGVLGITGLSAYFGVTEIGAVRPGETFVVSGAAGAVGSIAGQIAKIRGARVIGIAGGPAKCAWLRSEAGFDGTIDYQGEDVAPRLAELCPKGIDVFFDNVGGAILDAALARLSIGARVVLCGAISGYAQREFAPLRNYAMLTVRRARMQGFIILDYEPRYEEAITALSKWLSDGRLTQRLDVAHGLENAPGTLARLFRGENFGKQLLKVAEPELPVPTGSAGR